MKTRILLTTVMLCLALPAAAEVYDPVTGQQIIQCPDCAAGSTGGATSANQTNGNQQTQIVGTPPLATGAATSGNQTNGSQVAQTTLTPTTYQGVITLTAATSTALTAGNVTMILGSLPAAGAFAKLVLIAPTSCTFTVNLAGTAISGATQGTQIGAGALIGSDTFNISGLANAPTLYSVAGCTAIQFNN